jgi:CMP-N,N'-diacetyllegionaminic acid synthase
MRVLGLVPARGGSKGITRKNVALLRGRPLLWYTIDAARCARRLSRVVVTTDDPEIAEIGRSCGADVPFLRPAALADDAAPMLPVVQHAVGELEKVGDRYDAICLLHPTTPLRLSRHIDACIDLLEEGGCDAVVTVVPVPAEHNPHWVFFQNGDGTLRLSTGEATPIARRQDLPPAFCRDGSVYVTLRDVVMERSSLYGSRLLGSVLPISDTVDINDPTDWVRAERLLAEREPSVV